jgi:RimJ/RimL family protein N-acetyltransferase
MTGVRVQASTEARVFLESAGPWLLARPVPNSVLLTSAVAQAGARVAEPTSTYWWATDRAGQVVGALLHSPPRRAALVADVATPVAAALAAHVWGSGHRLGGVHGPVDAATAFARAWQRHSRGSVEPGMRQVVYTAEHLAAPDDVPGGLRQATSADRDLLVGWTEAFGVEVGLPPATGAPEVVDGWLSPGGSRLVLWEDAERRPVSMAGLSERVGGVARISLVYTPPLHRGRGYATACTAAAGRYALAAGARCCMLYADVDNPISNAVYRRIGFVRYGEAADLNFG